MVFLINLFIDLVLQLSLIGYYFLHNHYFVIANIIKFIPFWLVFIFIMELLIYNAVIFYKKNNMQAVLGKIKADFKPDSFLVRIYHKFTNASLLILLIITGNIFSAIIFGMSLFVASCLKNEIKS